MLTDHPTLVVIDGRRHWQLPSGRLLPYIAGGAGEPAAEPPAEPAAEPVAEPAGEPAAEPAGEPAAEPADDGLGDKGKKALDSMKSERKAALARANAAEAELAALKAEHMSDQEKAIETARSEARTETLAEANGRVFRAELRATAAGQLADQAIEDLLIDTAVATKLLGLDDIPVTDSGDIDSEAISQAVSAYVAARPHLAATATGTPGPIEQGARNSGGSSQPSLVEQIAKAEADGDWKRSAQLKTQQMMAG